MALHYTMFMCRIQELFRRRGNDAGLETELGVSYQLAGFVATHHVG